MRNLTVWLRSLLSYLRNPRKISNLWYFEEYHSKTRIYLVQPIILLVFVLVFAWYILFPTNVAVVGSVGLGGILVVSFLWARMMATQVECNRKLRYTAFQVGDELEEQIRMKNSSDLPVLWAEFIDHSRIPGYTVTSVQAAGIKLTQEWRAETICQKRGVFTLGPWEVIIGEPFGIFKVKKQYMDQSEIIVYPPLATLPTGILPKSKAVGTQNPLNQPIRAETIISNTTRPYATGDSLRRIHWRTSAHHQGLFVKVFEPEAASSVWIVPDFDAAVHVGEGVDSSLEMMVILVASLASDLLKSRLGVGLFLNSALPGDPTSMPRTILPRYGPAHIWTILRALAPVEAASDRPFSQTLTLAHNLLANQDMLIAVTPSSSKSWGKTLKGLIRNRLSSQHIPSFARAIFLDPASFIVHAQEQASLPRPISESNADEISSYLAALGISCSVIRKQDIKPTAGVHGKIRRWEFKTLGTGRVVVRQAPRSVGPEEKVS
jgi:uncharacterized protein (DUF58 family)